MPLLGILLKDDIGEVALCIGLNLIRQMRCLLKNSFLISILNIFLLNKINGNKIGEGQVGYSGMTADKK